MASKITNAEQYTFFKDFKDELNNLLNEETTKSLFYKNRKWYVHDVNESTVNSLFEKISRKEKSPYELACFVLNI
jgi:hypothetical protein